MDKHILVKDSQYDGQYIAFTSVVNHTVIAVGDKPEDVTERAKLAGATNPMIFFVPTKDMTCCF